METEISIKKDKVVRLIQRTNHVGLLALVEKILEDAEAMYQSSLANHAGAIATVKSAKVDLENTFIRAPFSGTILSKNGKQSALL